MDAAEADSVSSQPGSEEPDAGSILAKQAAEVAAQPLEMQTAGRALQLEQRTANVAEPSTSSNGAVESEGALTWCRPWMATLTALRLPFCCELHCTQKVQGFILRGCPCLLHIRPWCTTRMRAGHARLFDSLTSCLLLVLQFAFPLLLSSS